MHSSIVETQIQEDAATHLVAMRVEGISKRFPGVQALDDVGFDLRAGEVHALCGENGAGKSTLMKILAGGLQPDAGQIIFQGRPLALASPLEAKKQGILLVHQEISLVPDLSVAENLFLGSLPMRSFGRVDHTALHRKTTAVLASAGIDVDPMAIVGGLSIARQQMVEIARALAFKCSVVIFDEPTASLTDSETETLFAGIERLRQGGVAIAYISHKMKEIFRLSDRITVLRDGKVRGTLETAVTNEADVTRLMIGRSLDNYFHRAPRHSGQEVLRVEGFVVPGMVRGVSFAVRTGEVLGLYGLVGAGRSELVEAIFGLRARTAGTLHFDRRPVTVVSSRDAVRLGLALVPEDRKRQGLVLGMSNRHNIALAVLRRTSRFGFTNRGAEEAIFDEYQKRLAIKAPGSSTRTGTLSGGNQQKVVLAKWLATQPKVLILDEPTRGIDVGAKAEVHALIGRLAENGLALIVISSEMPEIMGLSHRILTMQQGVITGEFDGETVKEEDLVAAIMHRPLSENARRQ
jgi:ribose transport system ATP-binding protein